MDAVGRDEPVGNRCVLLAGVDERELGARVRAGVAVDPPESVAEVQALGPDPRDERVEQHLLEHAAVDRELRPRVARGEAARLAPDLASVSRQYTRLSGATDRAAS